MIGADAGKSSTLVSLGETSQQKLSCYLRILMTPFNVNWREITESITKESVFTTASELNTS